MPVQTKQELKDYVLRKLGAPVLEINVDDDQLDDRIDEAKDMFHQYHFDGTEKAYFAHTVTSTDVANKYISLDVKATGTLTLSGNVSDNDTVTIGKFVYTFKTAVSGQKHVLIGVSASDSIDNLISTINLTGTAGTTYGHGTVIHDRVTASAGAGDTMTITAKIPGSFSNSITTEESSSTASWGATRMSGGSTIQSVVRVLPINNNLGISGNIFNQAFNQQMHDFVNPKFQQGGGMVDYMIGARAINTISDTLGNEWTIHFNKVNSRLYIEDDWVNNIPAATIVVIELYKNLNFDENPEMYDDPWLKRYTTALTKKQWGSNLKKFSGTQLPGGVTINGQTYFDEGEKEIEALELELREGWELPPEVQLG